MITLRATSTDGGGRDGRGPDEREGSDDSADGESRAGAHAVLLSGRHPPDVIGVGVARDGPLS